MEQKRKTKEKLSHASMFPVCMNNQVNPPQKKEKAAVISSSVFSTNCEPVTVCMRQSNVFYLMTLSVVQIIELLW